MKIIEKFKKVKDKVVEYLSDWQFLKGFLIGMYYVLAVMLVAGLVKAKKAKK